MAKLLVYRFEYFDRAAKIRRVADDFATEKAIREVGGTVVRDSGKEVPEGEVTFSGIWRPDRTRP